MIKILTGLLLASALAAHAGLKLPAIIGDNMVLQQKQVNPIWGWDTPGTEVSVTFAGQIKTAKADHKGKWTVKLDPLPANSNPAIMSFRGSSVTEVKNVLVGEVWLCSGQSNMAFNVRENWGSDLEILASTNERIRFISIPNVGTQEMQDDFSGKWDVAAPETVGEFSAVGYFFGRQLQQTLNVPVGLIDNSWGGSPAEAWVKRDLMDADPRFEILMDYWRKFEATYDHDKALAQYAEQKKAWEAKRDAAKAAGKRPPPLHVSHKTG
jgi:sialate O-acetylesterase